MTDHDENDATATRSRRLPEIISIVVALLIAVTVWLVYGIGGDTTKDTGTDTASSPAVKVPAKDIRDVSIDMNLADLDLSIGGNDVDVEVRNDSGKALGDVLFDLKIEDPGGDFPYVGVTGGDEDCQYDADAERKRPKTEQAVCEKRWDEGKEWCKPKIEFPEPGTRHSQCWGSLDPGTNNYLYDMELFTDDAAVEEVAAEDVEGYPDLTVTAELSVDGEVFADFRGTITGDKVQP